MDFKTLERAIHYAMAPTMETAALLKQAHNNSNFAQHNNEDHVLADLLGEHGDPREHIVRKDLSYRNGDSSHAFYDNMHSDLEKLHPGVAIDGESKEHKLADGTKVGYSKTSQGKYFQMWWDTIPVGGGMYVANFSHEQIADMLSQMGLE